MKQRWKRRLSFVVDVNTKEQLADVVADYTKQQWMSIKEWPLYTSMAEKQGIVLDLTTNQSNAAANAFADYIWNQCQLE